MPIDMERFEATDILIANEFMLLELAKPEAYEYYRYNHDGTLDYIVGTERPMSPEELLQLYVNGYFDS